MRFCKKPIVIEAYQFENKMGEDTRPKWILNAIDTGQIYYQGGESPYLTIDTLEGKMRAHLGDWIIKGIKGELYPCKPDIFEATYEEVM